MWASSNSSLVRPSMTTAPAATACSTSCGVSGTGVPKSSTSGPRLRSTICLTLGGLSPSEPTASSTNSASSAMPRARLWLRSKPIVEQFLRSIAEPPQSEPPRWRGPELDLVVEWQQALVQGAEHRGRALARLHRQVGPGDVADEQRVAAEQRPGVAATAGVAQQEGGVLGPVPGRVHGLDREVAQLQHPAVAEGLVRVLGPGQLVDVDRRPGRPRQPPVPGDVVGVVVGLQHVPDPHPVQPRQPPVGLDVPLRIDRRRRRRFPGRRPGRRRSRDPRGLSDGRAWSLGKRSRFRLARKPGESSHS